MAALPGLCRGLHALYGTAWLGSHPLRPVVPSLAQAEALSSEPIGRAAESSQIGPPRQDRRPSFKKRQRFPVTPLITWWKHCDS